MYALAKIGLWVAGCRFAMSTIKAVSAATTTGHWNTAVIVGAITAAMLWFALTMPWKKGGNKTEPGGFALIGTAAFILIFGMTSLDPDKASGGVDSLFWGISNTAHGHPGAGKP